jgi:hypothetical protein
MRSMIASMLLVIALVATARATTWQVARDGSGDFTVIQDAVDVASSGDTIEIGPGRYDEFQTIWEGGMAYWDLFVYVDNKSLTFIGSGAGETIIGLEDPEGNEHDAYGIAAINGALNLRVEGITFEHINWVGIYLEEGHLEVEGCEFLDSQWGIYALASGGGEISYCHFARLDFGDGVTFYNPTHDVTVHDCTFEDTWTGVGSYWPETTGIQIYNCDFDGGRVAVHFADQASGTVHDCTIANVDGYGFTCSNCRDVEFYDNFIDEPNGTGVGLSRAFGLNFHDNIVASEERCVFVAAVGEAEFHNNHILRGEGAWYVETTEYFPWTYHLDMTNNYWGTTDLDEIAEWIWDGYDQDDVEIYIDYEPIADQPVGTEQRSWSDVKALYGGR